MPVPADRVKRRMLRDKGESPRKQVAAGRQAYVVYPVIEENEENELKAAMKMYGEH